MIVRMAAVLWLSAAATGYAAAVCPRELNFAEPIISSLNLQAVYGDFNEDGRIDVALMDTGRRVIALNRGSVFEPQPAEYLNAPSDTKLVTATDVNHDGHLDLVYRIANYIGVALGRGDGTFQPLRSSSIAGNWADRYRTIDFNHDGSIDFIDTGSVGSQPVTFIKSNGDGTFAPVVSIGFSTPLVQSVETAAGDFDGDGNVDAVEFATDLNDFRTLITFAWNDGTDHFTQQYASYEVPHNLQPVDLDGDGSEELVGIDNGSLVVLHAKDRKISVERMPVTFSGVSQLVRNPMMLDVDGDGIRDLVFNAPYYLVGVIRGTADGKFADAKYYELPGNDGFVPVDLDGDGIPDVGGKGGWQGVFAIDGASLRVPHQHSSRVYPLPVAPFALEMGDVDGDGVHDIIVAGGAPDSAHAPYQVVALLGDGHGSFNRTTNAIDLYSPLLVTGDFDGDGHTDVATSPGGSGPVRPQVVFGTSDGFGGTPLDIDADAVVGRVFVGSSPALIALKGDDVQLITISSGRSATASIVYHRPAGSHVFAVNATPGAAPQIAVVTIDGALRVITAASDAWHETILAAAPRYQNIQPSGVIAADLNGDGRTDYVVAATVGAVFFANADGTYSAGLPGVGPSAAVADLDGDGRPDIVVSDRGNFDDPGVVTVFRNAGGTFQRSAVAITGPWRGSTIAVDDVDGDGMPDVIVPTDGVEVLTNICARPRIKVDVLPRQPLERAPMTLVIHAMKASAIAMPRIIIREAGKVLLQQDSSYGTVTWTSAPLSPGKHTYAIEWTNDEVGDSQVSVDVTTVPATRRRSARH